MKKQQGKIPLILDTDIGNDIDDSWALALLLKSIEIDLKYVLTATGDTEYRARIVAKMLQVAERTEIPIGMGRHTFDHERTVEAWIDDFEWNAYPGPAPHHGVEQMVRMIMEADEAPTILCIGPMTNLADALALEPQIAERCQLVAMSGSFEKHEDGRKGQIAEWNVRNDISAAQKVYSAPWKSIRITPLDSCGILRLSGESLQRVRESTCPLVRSLMGSVDCWAECLKDEEWPDRSSILFDTVAAYLSFGSELLKMEHINLVIDDEGYMRRSKQGAPVEYALDWNNMDGFKKLLSERLA